MKESHAEKEAWDQTAKVTEEIDARNKWQNSDIGQLAQNSLPWHRHLIHPQNTKRKTTTDHRT